MANVASMGPPPSPKEPRRSGRRSGPSTSTSKSPTGSPTSEADPKPRDTAQRPPLPSSSSSSRNKRAKNEDTDDIPDDNHKNGLNGTSNGRARRKGKNNAHARLPLARWADAIAHTADATLGDSNGQEEEEEEQGVTRCICQETGSCSWTLTPVLGSSGRTGGLQASTNRKLESSWLNARFATRGSTGRAWATNPLKLCHCTTTAKSAGLTYIPNFSSAYLPSFPLAYH